MMKEAEHERARRGPPFQSAAIGAVMQPQAHADNVAHRVPEHGTPGRRPGDGQGKERDIMWAVYALLAALGGAVMATLTKAGLKRVDSNIGLAVQSVLILLIAWGTVAFQGNLRQLGSLDRRNWAYLLLAGVATGVSSLFLYQALKLGNASRVVPLDRLSLVFAILLGSVFLKEEVGWQVIVGGGLMAAGALVIASAGE
jgi:bacterial/archaeal transporter family protein